MIRSRNFQKRKNGTAPTILGQHNVREELDPMSISNLYIQSISNLPQDPTVEQQEEENCGILERQDADEFIFSAGEVVVFRGRDDLKFNLMIVTKTLNRDKTNLRTKISGNFLTEQEQQDDCVTFFEDKDWMGANMAFTHMLRDEADVLMTVHLDKCESLESTIYRMNIETYEELVALSDRYEHSQH